MKRLFLALTFCFQNILGVAAAYDAAGYHRNEEQTFLTVPEWYIVYSPDEYARFIKDQAPSRFPYFQSISLFWKHYRCVWKETKPYPFNWGYHVMILVIGTSYSAELVAKGIYEDTVGRFSEWTSSGQTMEDVFAADVARNYVDFIRIRPWYEYPFQKKLKELWEMKMDGPNKIRKLERRIFLSCEYGVKATYGWLIGRATHAAYEAASPVTLVRVKKLPSDLASGDSPIQILQRESEGIVALTLPRYQPFTDYALKLAKRGVLFVDIAGNKKILLTVISDSNRRPFFKNGEIIFTFPIPINKNQERLGLFIPVNELTSVLKDLDSSGIAIEHIYDY